MFFMNRMSKSTGNSSEQIEKLKKALEEADAVLIGAGAGMSAAAGFSYSGARFETWFSDFRKKYGFTDMYSGGFYPYDTMETYWAFWSRYIWINRYQDAPKSVYGDLLELVRDRDYFVLTTNVDHCFQKAGFDRHKLFYTQGDYGLFQCSEPCCRETFDNEETVRQMLQAQGYFPEADHRLTVSDGREISMAVPTSLVPRCPHCGKPMTMNLRCDDTFVQDDGWYAAQDRYREFLRRHRNCSMLYLELGVGGNTPVIIKYPFWKYTAENPNAVYACVNDGEACVPEEIAGRAICLDEDIAVVFSNILKISKNSQLALDNDPKSD